MEPIIEQFFIESQKLKNDKKIISMADLHINLKLNKKVLLAIQKFLYESSKIDLITISGDTLYASEYLRSEYMRKLEYLLSSFREIAPVVLSLGNHDIEKREEEAKKSFKSLEKIKNVYPLDNESIKINDMTVTGFYPRYQTYEKRNDGLQSEISFVKDFNNSGITFDEEEFNILLNHEPRYIKSRYTQSKLTELYEYVDLIVAGHLHNGYVPEIIERIFHEKIKDYGITLNQSIIPPRLFSKVNLCRGIYSLGNAKLIVTKGGRKYNGILPSALPIRPNLTEIEVIAKRKTLNLPRK